MSASQPQPGLGTHQAEAHLRGAGYSCFTSWHELSAGRRRPAAQPTARSSTTELRRPLGVARALPPAAVSAASAAVTAAAAAGEATPPLVRAQRALRRLSETGANCDVASRQLEDCIALLDGIGGQDGHPSRPPTPSSTVSCAYTQAICSCL